MREYERAVVERGFTRPVGIDEAGRGPLAGPVVAAAVYMPQDITLDCIYDSKQLSPKKRDIAYEEILKYGMVGIGKASPQEIDELNVLQATFLAMRRAVRALSAQPSYAFVDGNLLIPELGFPQQALVKGDATCYPIAAASIIAKVTRDRIMDKYHAKYPQYGFDQHKGYPTKQHRLAITSEGPCPIHRRTFGDLKRGNAS